ncbi:MAG: type II toxin-antitoxin system HicB family antitoxin [archaeon]|nr:type II toxin-antitoxin system HicB family antitoxin [archaeon]MCP8314001.1 type II toxin-antitoxin system HicB family antitoxin [archaeon]MCP8317600.1 type II toxin-antitoxin system HicB family antitoxin [archaeon]MCP8321036.1 type II toxin-antitoxin system HicB family antitoxin [archaeon]
MSRKRVSIKPRRFTAILMKAEEGGYSVQCLELPAAISQGETKEEAIKNLKEAITLVLEHLEEKAKAQKAEVLEVAV